MGIAVTLLAPDTPERQADRARRRPVHGAGGQLDRRASPAAWRRSKPTLCRQGTRRPTASCRRTTTTAAPTGAWNAQTGSPTNEVGIANFLYTPGDLSTITMTGVPTVKLGETLNFTNLEGTAIYHTVTSCAFPCLGPTGRRVPARRRQDERRPRARLRLVRARHRRPRDRPGEADPALGAAGDRGGGLSSPARSSPTSAASTRPCEARSR